MGKEPTIEINESDEFPQLWDDMTHKLRNGVEAFEYPSVCYILRSEKCAKGVHRVISNHLEEKDPPHCYVVDNKEVWAKFRKSSCVCPPEIKGTCVTYEGIWDYDRILDKFVRQSGFPNVETWLENWSKSITDFEYDEEYKLWLIKLYYPQTNRAIPIKNDANKPIDDS